MYKKKVLYFLKVYHLLQRAHTISAEVYKSFSSQVPTTLLITALIILWLLL